MPAMLTLSLLLATGLTCGQDTGPEPARPGDPHAEQRRLAEQIEHSLRQVDRALLDASAPGPRGARRDLAGCLRTAEAGSRRAVEDLDRLLALADRPHAAGSGCSRGGL